MDNKYTLPSSQCMTHCCKLAVAEDKPIMFDYWTDSLDKSVLIGYTSPIVKIYKAENEYIVVTENSLYIVSSDIPTRRIS